MTDLDPKLLETRIADDAAQPREVHAQWHTNRLIWSFGTCLVLVVLAVIYEACL